MIDWFNPYTEVFKTRSYERIYATLLIISRYFINYSYLTAIHVTWS